MRRMLLTVLLVTAVSISLSGFGGPALLTQAAAKTEQGKPASASAKGSPTAEALITAADVEKVGGLTGIKQVVQGDKVNFTTQDNKMVLRVQVRHGDSLYKQTKATNLNFHASVSGIGEDAFDGPSDAMNMGAAAPGAKPQPYLLWFLKANTSVSLTTFANTAHPQFYLSQDKLRELAKIMASRF